MKSRHFIIIGVVVLVIALIGFSISDNKGKKKTKQKKQESIRHYAVKEVQNDTFSYDIFSHGIVKPIHQMPISSEVQGKMLPGSVPFKEGATFQKGQVIYKIDNEEFLYTLAAQKASYVNMIASIIPDIQLDFPDQKEKWQSYLNEIKMNQPLPELPMWDSQKEKVFLASKNIISEYFNIKSQEKRVEKYSLRAPFTGMILSTTTQPYANVSPGVELATIMQTNAFELKVPFQSKDMKYIDNGTKADIIHNEGYTIGQARVERISDVINSNTQSVDVYFKIYPLDTVEVRSGQYVNIEVNTGNVANVFQIPRKALAENNKVYTYNTQDSLLTQQRIELVRTLKDSYLIRGIQDGQLLITDRVETYNDTTKVGVIRR